MKYCDNEMELRVDSRTSSESGSICIMFILLLGAVLCLAPNKEGFNPSLSAGTSTATKGPLFEVKGKILQIWGYHRIWQHTKMSAFFVDSQRSLYSLQCKGPLYSLFNKTIEQETAKHGEVQLGTLRGISILHIQVLSH